METTNTPGFVPVNADPMKNRCGAPAGCTPEKKEDKNAPKNSDTTGNAAKVAAGAVAGAGVVFGAQAAANVLPDDLDASIILDGATDAVENITSAPAPAQHNPASTASDILENEENDNNEDEEEEFNVEDIRLELDEEGEIVSINHNTEHLPEIFEVETDEPLLAEIDDPIPYPDGLDENGMPFGNPYATDEIEIDEPSFTDDIDIDLASDDSGDIIDII